MKRTCFVLMLAILGLGACSESADSLSSSSERASVTDSKPISGDRSVAEQLYHSQPPVTPELAKAGEWDVGVTTFSATNPQQLSTSDYEFLVDRKLTLEVWYPAKLDGKAELATYTDQTRSGKSFTLQGKSYRDAEVVAQPDQFPLVVLSHGYTGYRTVMFYLAEHLASHGYVVVGVDHTDSTNADLIGVDSPFSKLPSTFLNRARDQQFVLDYFAQLDTPLGKVVVADKASVIGHSMGGYGAINTVGACFNFTAGSMRIFGFPADAIATLLPVFNTCNAGRASVDPRWKAMIAYAPWGGELDLFSIDSLNNISVPSLYVAGDDDDVSGYENGVKKLFEQTGTASSSAQETYMLVYENARHNIVGHPAPKAAYANELDLGHYYEPAWDTETLNRINQHMNLAFLNCHVKAEKEACAFLPQREDITQVKQGPRTMSDPWPGFQPRWGTGVRFYRRNSI